MSCQGQIYLGEKEPFPSLRNLTHDNISYKNCENRLDAVMKHDKK